MCLAMEGVEASWAGGGGMSAEILSLQGEVGSRGRLWGECTLPGDGEGGRVCAPSPPCSELAPATQDAPARLSQPHQGPWIRWKWSKWFYSQKPEGKGSFSEGSARSLLAPGSSVLGRREVGPCVGRGSPPA